MPKKKGSNRRIMNIKGRGNFFIPPYICKICDKVFTWKVDFNKHRKHCTVLYTCDICQTTLRSQYNFKQHLKSVKHLKMICKDAVLDQTEAVFFKDEAEDVFVKQEGEEEVEHDQIRKELSEQDWQKLCEEDPLQADLSIKSEIN